ARVVEHGASPARRLDARGPPPRSPGRVVGWQQPPAQDGSVVQARSEDSLPIGGEGQPGPAGSVMDHPTDAPAPEIHDDRVGHSLVTRDRHELAIRRNGTPARCDPGKCRELCLRELDAEVSLGTAEGIETSPPEDDQPMATEAEGLE